MTTAWDRGAAAGRLGEALDVLALPAPSRACDRLLDLCELLARWAARISLTAHRDPDAILDRLVLDAAALATVLPAGETVADLGAGAGLPGLPLAILLPDRRFTLVEARERKHHFQREAIRRLELDNVRALLGRAETLSAEPHAGALAQAVAPPAEVVGLLLPWAMEGGWIAIPGGAQPPALPASAEIETCEIRRYRVPPAGPSRTVWIGRRSAVSP